LNLIDLSKQKTYLCQSKIIIAKQHDLSISL